MTHLARLLLASSLLLTACKSAQMKVDPDLADDRMKVSRTGRWGGGDLVFGEFRARDIDRGWTKSTTIRVGNHERTRSRQKYWFELQAAEASTGKVRCETVQSEHGATYGRLRIDRAHEGLGCTIDTMDGAPRGELVLLDGDRPLAQGHLMLDGTVIELVAERRAEGAAVSSYAPLGYELRIDGKALGAVQTINGGAVWIDGAAPAPLREAAAMAAATVLLYQPMDDH